MTTKEINICVKAISPFDGTLISSILSYDYSKEGITIYPEDSEEYKERVDAAISWQFDSHPNNFEVMDPYTCDEFRLAQGQVIGSIFIKSIKTYIKVIWSGKIKNSITLANKGTYKDKEAMVAVQLLNQDLDLGLNVININSDFTIKSFNRYKNIISPPVELPAHLEHTYLNDFVARFNNNYEDRDKKEILYESLLFPIPECELKEDLKKNIDIKELDLNFLEDKNILKTLTKIINDDTAKNLINLLLEKRD